MDFVENCELGLESFVSLPTELVQQTSGDTCPAFVVTTVSHKVCSAVTMLNCLQFLNVALFVRIPGNCAIL